MHLIKGRLVIPSHDRMGIELQLVCSQLVTRCHAEGLQSDPGVPKGVVQTEVGH
jgi:hypothetical protein